MCRVCLMACLPRRKGRLMCTRSYAGSEPLLVPYSSTTPLWTAWLSYEEMVDPVWKFNCHTYVCFTYSIILTSRTK